jgi:hypothetical protein
LTNGGRERPQPMMNYPSWKRPRRPSKKFWIETRISDDFFDFLWTWNLLNRKLSIQRRTGSLIRKKHGALILVEKIGNKLFQLWRILAERRVHRIYFFKFYFVIFRKAIF